MGRNGVLCVSQLANCGKAFVDETVKRTPRRGIEQWILLVKLKNATMTE